MNSGMMEPLDFKVGPADFFGKMVPTSEGQNLGPMGRTSNKKNWPKQALGLFFMCAQLRRCNYSTVLLHEGEGTVHTVLKTLYMECFAHASLNIYLPNSTQLNVWL